MTEEQQNPDNGAQAADSAGTKAAPRRRRTSTRTPRIGRARRQKKASDSPELPLTENTPAPVEAARKALRRLRLRVRVNKSGKSTLAVATLVCFLHLRDCTGLTTQGAKRR